MARGKLVRGPVSWYGGPNDHEDNNIPALPGASNRNPGIAVYDRATLGGYWRVRDARGRAFIFQQTDLGPAPWAGKLDINAAAIPVTGYTEGNFPTDQTWSARYLGRDRRWAALAGRAVGDAPVAPRAARRQQQGAGMADAASQAGVSGALAALLSAQAQRPVIQSQGLTGPAFSARPVLPQGYSAPPISMPQQRTGGLAEQLAAVSQLYGPEATVTPGTSPRLIRGTAPAGRAPAGRGSAPSNLRGRAWPTGGTRGQIIGTPYSGTHSLGNWQSDNALDIGVPNGTPILSIGNGVVEKVAGGYSGGSSRFDGYQITVRFDNGQRAFYTHLERAGVKPGQRLKNGQQIGLSGSANGVPHLHFGVERGNPMDLVRRGKVVPR